MVVVVKRKGQTKGRKVVNHVWVQEPVYILDYYCAFLSTVRGRADAISVLPNTGERFTLNTISYRSSTVKIIGGKVSVDGGRKSTFALPKVVRQHSINVVAKDLPTWSSINSSGQSVVHILTV